MQINTGKKSIIAILLLYPLLCSAQKYGIRTNILGLATGSFNIEASVALSDKWTLHMPFSWNPFILKGNYKIQHIAVEPGARFWFWHSYTGLFCGSQTILAKFNVGINDYRYQGWTAGESVSVGYSYMLSRKWNIEAELEAGMFWTEYDKYQRPLCGEYEDSGKRIFIGPGRVSVAIVYIF